MVGAEVGEIGNRPATGSPQSRLSPGIHVREVPPLAISRNGAHA
jgi:hypothetical protein